MKRVCKTLADHAEAWWLENGWLIPNKHSKEFIPLYEIWVEWAFSDLHGTLEGKRGQ